MKYILMAIFLVLPVQAHADWSSTGMHPMGTPNFTPNQTQPAHVNAPRQAHVEPSRPVQHYAAAAVNRAQPVRQPQAVNRPKPAERREASTPGYFRRDFNYYGHVQVPFPYSDVDTGFNVPDGYDTIMVNGETFYYNEGVFYQQVGDQLTVIPAVLGAVVDSIPQDYQIVMADGVHYLVTGGVYYQRVDQGFEVVEPPVPQGS